MSHGRSVLAVPGSSQRFLVKAATSAADVIMIDWEDGVSGADKPTSRELTLAFLNARSLAEVTGARNGPHAWLRVNSPETEDFALDAAALDQWATTDYQIPVIIPMAATETVNTAADRLPHRPLIAMIETAKSLEQARELAANPRVIGLMFGEYDYLATMANSGSLRMTDTTWAQARLVNAAAASGKWAIAGPNADFSDNDGLRHQASREAELGFAGKLCIHPSQIAMVNKAFAPAPAFVRWAEELLAELGNNQTLDGAFNFRGQMVDPPVIDRARTAVRMAGGAR
ncbi:HpcH/HpaI aldolase/citrate lyase family protein [Paenarthrobacter aurescens]|uniref:HpcH/HpaI aldolase/citrate lyase family protein n=1 Tax=Paenarthrobacter aurescens TaxID=43663 RepID=UPI0035F064CB